jgi:hypothetical protein
LLLYSKRLAKENCASLPENIIYCTNCFALSFVPTICVYVRFLSFCNCRLRSTLYKQNNAMCRGVSCPAPHLQVAVKKPRTLCLYKNSASLILFVQACVSKALFAFRSSLWSLSTCAVNGVSLETTRRFPRSVLGCTIRSSL